MTPEQQRAIVIAKARKRKAEATGGNSGPIQGQIDQVNYLGKLNDFTRKGNTGRLTTAALSAANSSTLGALDPIMDGVDRAIPGYTGPDSASVRHGLREEHPVSGVVGDIAGFAGPGAAIWKAGGSLGKALPQLPGKGSRYAGRLLGLAGMGGAENAVFQSTVGASNLSASTGEPVSIPERLEMAREGGTNPIALAAGPAMSLAGRGISGAFTGKVTPKNLRPGANAPQLDQIEGMKNEAYQLADELGVTYTPDSYQNLIANLETRLASEGIDPVLHQRATRTLSRMQDRVGDKPMTMQELDKIRQFVRRDVIQSAAAGSTPGANAGEQRLGMMMVDAIDDFIESGTGAVGANGQAGSEAIRRARSLNSVWRKSQTLQDAVENAQLRSASTGSGGNFENALRQEIRKIYQNPKKVAGFSEAEREVMRAVIEGTPIQNILRNVGKLSPQGNGLMAALGIGTTAANPWLAPVWIAGMGAKHLSQQGIRNSFDELDTLVRGRANALAKPPMKNITPGSGGSTNALAPEAQPDFSVSQTMVPGDRGFLGRRLTPDRISSEYSFETSGGNQIKVSSGQLYGSEDGTFYVDWSANGQAGGLRPEGMPAQSLGETNEILRGVEQAVRRVIDDHNPTKIVMGPRTEKHLRIYQRMLERADLQGYRLSFENSREGPQFVLTRAESPVMQNGLPGGTIAGAAIGGINPDFNQDGEVSFAERMAGIAGGAAIGRFGPRLASRADDVATNGLGGGVRRKRTQNQIRQGLRDSGGTARPASDDLAANRTGLRNASAEAEAAIPD